MATVCPSLDKQLFRGAILLTIMNHGVEPSNAYESNGYSQAATYEPVDLTAGFENVASMMGNLSFLDLA